MHYYHGLVQLKFISLMHWDFSRYRLVQCAVSINALESALRMHRVVRRQIRKCKMHCSSGPSHLTSGLLQQPSDRNSNKPHEPARNGPTSSCSSHLSILRAPVCNCVDEGPTLVASHFPCPLQGPCPSIQVQKWTWSGVFDQYALCLHSSPWLTFSQLWAAG